MKNTANQDLRNAARDAGVPLWAIADVLHISEPTMLSLIHISEPTRH